MGGYMKLFIIISFILYLGCSNAPPTRPIDTKYVIIKEIQHKDYFTVIVKHKHNLSLKKKRKLRKWYRHHYRHHPSIRIEFINYH